VGRRRINGLSRTSALRFGACDATLFSAVALLFEQFCLPRTSLLGSRRNIATAGILAQCAETPQQSRKIKANPAVGREGLSTNLKHNDDRIIPAARGLARSVVSHTKCSES
jgi:hypothetical protein